MGFRYEIGQYTNEDLRVWVLSLVLNALTSEELMGPTWF